MLLGETLAVGTRFGGTACGQDGAVCRPCSVEVSAQAAVPVEAVWSYLCDPYSFALWVSGTARVRRADASWPAVGASLYHRWGPWPVRVRDCTTVTCVHAPHAMSMVARARPIAVVHVDLALEEVTDGVRVVLRESIVAGLSLRCRWLTGRVQLWRNRRSVVRLLRLVAEREA